MKLRNYIARATRTWVVGVLFIALGGVIQNCGAQTPSPGLDEVVKLSKAQMSDDVILNYVRGSGKAYNLSADDILYLKGQGVSQPVISALLQTKSAGAPPPPAGAPPTDYSAQPPPQSVSSDVPPPGAPPPPSAPPPPADGADQGDASQATTTVVNFDYVHDQLTPYGTWEQQPGYGWVWRPSEISDNPDWRPYYDQGNWVYSDQGWCWQSQYPWGDVAFHYGRWARIGYGWAWVPGYDWAPAWVAWRHAEAEGAVGWAPLPPDAEFRVGVGVFWHGRVGVDLDFGLGPDAFTFIGYDHFWEHDYRRFAFDHDRARYFYGRSVIRNGYGFDHGHFVVEGLGRDRIALLTHHDVRVVRAMDFRHEEEHRDFARRVEAHPEIRRAGFEHHEEFGRPGEHGFAEHPGERVVERPGEHGVVEHSGEHFAPGPGGVHGGGPSYGGPAHGAPGKSQAPPAKSSGGSNNGGHDSKDKPN